jgi:hypothetical protein
MGDDSLGIIVTSVDSTFIRPSRRTAWADQAQLADLHADNIGYIRVPRTIDGRTFCRDRIGIEPEG